MYESYYNKSIKLNNMAGVPVNSAKPDIPIVVYIIASFIFTIEVTNSLFSFDITKGLPKLTPYSNFLNPTSSILKIYSLVILIYNLGS